MTLTDQAFMDHRHAQQLVPCRYIYAPQSSNKLVRGPAASYTPQAGAGILDAYGHSMLVNEYGVPIMLPVLDHDESGETSPSGARAPQTVRSSAISKDLAASPLSSSSYSSDGSGSEYGSEHADSDVGSWHSES